jgi:hypothetical protein
MTVVEEEEKLFPLSACLICLIMPFIFGIMLFIIKNGLGPPNGISPIPIPPNGDRAME